MWTIEKAVDCIVNLRYSFKNSRYKTEKILQEDLLQNEITESKFS